jgi:predicted enzyme related to lactoylglutathione lyase
VFGNKLTGWACLAAFIALVSTGCGAVVKNGHAVLVGAVYTRVKFPLTTDLDQTPAAVDTGGGKVVRIKEPFSGYGIYAEFDSNAIGEIAKRHGLKTVYYADIERLSILGIWRHDEVIVCGEK